MVAIKESEHVGLVNCHGRIIPHDFTLDRVNQVASGGEYTGQAIHGVKTGVPTL
jgi:hypothetical protein